MSGCKNKKFITENRVAVQQMYHGGGFRTRGIKKQIIIIINKKKKRKKEKQNMESIDRDEEGSEKSSLAKATPGSLRSGI